MLKQKEYILNTEEDFKQIESVKELVQEMHDSGNFFNLSLKTLELIRRFNNLFIDYFKKGNESSSVFNQLVVTAKNLETELVRGN